MNKKLRSFFRLSTGVESAEPVAEDIPAVSDLPTEVVVDPETPPNVVALTTETEAQIQALDDRAVALENLADIAEQIPAADENHAMLVELAAEQAVSGTDIDLENEVVPALESAIGKRIDTTGIRAAAAQMRTAQKALKANIGLESFVAGGDDPEFDVGMEGVGADIGNAFKKMFSAWKDDAEGRDPWSYGNKEIIEKLKTTYGNREWVEMRGLKGGEIKLPAGGWAEYLIMPDGKLASDNPQAVAKLMQDVLAFNVEIAEAYRAYHKELKPIYTKTLSQTPEVALQYAREQLAKVKSPAARMTIKELKLSADRHIKLNSSGSYYDDFEESEVPGTIPALKDAAAVVAMAEVCIKCSTAFGNADLSFNRFWGDTDFGWWNSAYRALPEADFNWLWRSFNNEAIKSQNGLFTAGVKSLYSSIASIQALEYVLDRSVK